MMAPSQLEGLDDEEELSDGSEASNDLNHDIEQRIEDEAFRSANYMSTKLFFNNCLIFFTFISSFLEYLSIFYGQIKVDKSYGKKKT